MLELVLAEPILLTPEERYLHGHYLAYLLSGSREARPLPAPAAGAPQRRPRRLLLGVTYAIMADATDEAIGKPPRSWTSASKCGTFLSPIVMSKYLSCRESPARRKLFRQTRKAIGDQSAYAQKKMLDPQGVLNPGLMPQKLADLNLLAPARTEVDDVLVERWNRVAEVWRDQADFRTAVLRYATSERPPRPRQHGIMARSCLPLDRTRSLAPPDPRPHRGHLGLHQRQDPPRCRTPASCSTGQSSGSSRRPWSPSSMNRSNLLVENPRLDDEASRPFAAGRPMRPTAYGLAHRQPGQPGGARERAGRVRQGKEPGAAGRPRSPPLRPESAPRPLEGSASRHSRARARPGRAPSPPAIAPSRSAPID